MVLPTESWNRDGEGERRRACGRRDEWWGWPPEWSSLPSVITGGKVPEEEPAGALSVLGRPCRTFSSSRWLCPFPGSVLPNLCSVLEPVYPHLPSKYPPLLACFSPSFLPPCSLPRFPSLPSFSSSLSFLPLFPSLPPLHPSAPFSLPPSNHPFPFCSFVIHWDFTLPATVLILFIYLNLLGVSSQQPYIGLCFKEKTEAWSEEGCFQGNANDEAAVWTESCCFRHPSFHSPMLPGLKTSNLSP